MITQHTITIAELEAYVKEERWTRYASAEDYFKQLKTLELCNDGRFRVSRGRKVVYCGNSIAVAVSTYNDK